MKSPERARASGTLIRRGADLVHVSEELHIRLLALTLTMLGVAAVLTVPLAQTNSREHVGPATAAFVVMALVGSVVGLCRRRELYRWLRADRLHQLAPAVMACAMLLADGPYSPSWWMAQGLLFTVAAVADAGTTCLGGMLAATGYLAGTTFRGASLMPGGDVEYVTVALSLVVNPLVARAIAEIFARFTLRLHQIERQVAGASRPLLRVDVTSGPASAARAEPTKSVTPTVDATRERRRRWRSHGVLGLTARQLQVALLVRDGLRQGEIAAALAISPRQVERHLEQARERANASTTAHLIAMLVGHGVAPDSPPPQASAP